MKINYQHFLLILVSLITFLPNQKSMAHVTDSLNTPFLQITKQAKLENTIIANYSTIQTIVPHLMKMQRQIPIIKGIIENYKKVENLWGFYEEAKRDGKNLTDSPLMNELTYLSKYTLYLVDESLDKILGKLNNESLRVALVEWKSRKLNESKQIYLADKKDLERLEKMQPSIMENPTITNTAKLANLLNQRDSLYKNSNSGKVLGESRRNQGGKLEEVTLFYTCDMKKRLSDNAPESIMDFTADKAIQIIRLDREIYQFRLTALAGLPYKEQQYFKLKKELVVAAHKEEKNTPKRKFLKPKTDPTSHHSLLLKEYNQLVDSFTFEEQNKLRDKEGVFNHEVISMIEFWGCPAFFPSFYNK